MRRGQGKMLGRSVAGGCMGGVQALGAWEGSKEGGEGGFVAGEGCSRGEERRVEHERAKLLQQLDKSGDG